MPFNILLRLVVLTCVLTVCSCQGKGGGGKGGSINGGGAAGKGSGKNSPRGFLGQPTPNGNNPGSPPRARSGGGIISAWGIITLIMLIIVGALGIYYFSIFYPLICAERGKYDVMEMSTI